MNNLLNYIIKITFFFAILGFNYSCSKDIVKTSDYINNNGEIFINTVGIDNLQESIEFKSSSNTNSTNPSYIVNEYNDVDLISTIIDNSNQTDESLKMKSSINVNIDTLSDGIKYMLYVFDGNKFVTSKLFTVGISSSISGLDPTKKYNWSAVSYNSKEIAPPFEGITSLIIPQNTELLFAKGEIDLKVTENITILFKRSLARIIIELNTIGVSGDLNCPDNSCFDVSPSSTRPIKLFGGTLNLITGSIQVNSNPYSASFNFKNVDHNFHDRKQTVMYTTLGEATTSIGVVLKNITVTDYDGQSQRTYFKNATAGTGGRSYSVNNEYGKSKRLVLNLVHSHLTTSLGTRWARSNLYKRYNIIDRISNIESQLNTVISENDKSSLLKNILELEKRLHALPSTNIPSLDENSFFAITDEDPCSKLYPYKLWRLPTQAEIMEFTTNNEDNALEFESINIPSSIESIPNGYINYIPVTVPQTSLYANSLADNTVLFYYNGYYKNGQNYANKLAAFWTNETVSANGTNIKIGEIGELGGFMSYPIELENNQVVLQSYRTKNITTGTKKNVRCVRSNHLLPSDDINNTTSAP